MSGGSTPTRLISPLRLLATFCVLAPTVAVIAVPTYNSSTPKLGGFPFFYWYQLLWVVVTGTLMVLAFWAIRLDEGHRRAARAAGTGGAGAGTAVGTGTDAGSITGADAGPETAREDSATADDGSDDAAEHGEAGA